MQLFSWRIGQAQTYEGAKITSTNTDGLFSVMESELNNKILSRESADIGVEIEPEPTFLISKDTNNRVEMNPNTGEVQAASGGTLGCRNWAGKKGPQPTKNLSHPAIIDWALCEYLVFAATDKTGRASLEKPFNPEVGLNILLSAQNKMDKIKLLNMFQNVVASSPNSIRYNFALKHGNVTDPIVLQHYNRVFIMKDGTPNCVHLNAAVARKLTPVQIKNRKKNDERPVQHDLMAIDILAANGVPSTSLPENYEAIITKLTNIENDWFMLIENRALQYIPDDEVDFILSNLDYGKYLYLLGNSFEKSWRNILPNALDKTNMEPFTKDLQSAMDDFKSGKNTSSVPEKTTKKTKSPKKIVNKITPDAQDGQSPIQIPEDQQKVPASSAIQEAANTANIIRDIQASDESITPEDMLPWPEADNHEPEMQHDTQHDKCSDADDIAKIQALLHSMLSACDELTAIINSSKSLENINQDIQSLRASIMTAIEQLEA